VEKYRNPRATEGESIYQQIRNNNRPSLCCFASEQY